MFTDSFFTFSFLCPTYHLWHALIQHHQYWIFWVHLNNCCPAPMSKKMMKAALNLGPSEFPISSSLTSILSSSTLSSDKTKVWTWHKPNTQRNLCSLCRAWYQQCCFDTTTMNFKNWCPNWWDMHNPNFQGYNCKWKQWGGTETGEHAF